MATFTNKTKNIASPYNGRKAAIYYWGDAVATWGDSVATWGNGLLSVTNQNKSGTSTFLITDEGDFLITDEGDYLCSILGGAVTNQSKS